MPVTSHFRTDAETLQPNGNWLPVFVDLHEDAGELIIESNTSVAGNDFSETPCQLSPPSDRDFRIPSPTNIRRVEINKGDEGLGVSIKGGADHHMPVTISKIFRGMAADRTRQLFVGDSIVSVNGISLLTATHEEAVKALRSAGHKVSIEVQYLPAAAKPQSRANESNSLQNSSEILPPLGEIGWGTLTTMSSVKLSDEVVAEEETEEEPSPRSSWWRRVCSLRLAGVQFVQQQVTRIPSRNSSTSQNSSGESDSNNRVVRIHSPDLTRFITLRFASPSLAGSWFTWLSSIVDRQTDSFRDRVNEFFMNPNTTIAMNSQMPYSYPGQFWITGWLDTLTTQQSLSEPVFDQFTRWQRIFAAVTEKDFVMFDRAPSLSHDSSDAVFKAAVGTWLAKHEIARIPLIFSRLVSNQHSESSFVSADSSSRHLLFGLRVARLPPRISSPSLGTMLYSGMLLPVEWRTLRADSPPSLATWCRAIINGCHRSVSIIRALRFAVLFSGRLCALEIAEDCISLYDVEDVVQPVYWTKPLSSVAGSSDDGSRLLHLNINDVGLIELEMASESDLITFSKNSSVHINSQSLGLNIVASPKPIVFALHSFLSAKLANLGIIA